MNQTRHMSYQGEFFIENRNILKNQYGLLAAIVPDKPEVGCVNKCELILVTKLFVDSKGKIKLTMHKFFEGVYMFCITRIN